MQISLVTLHALLAHHFKALPSHIQRTLWVSHAVWYNLWNDLLLILWKTMLNKMEFSVKCQKGGIPSWISVFCQSQAEAHYKGNRHARRVKGIETSKTARLQDGDKQHPPLTASPTPPGPEPSSPEPDPNRQGVHCLWHVTPTHTVTVA